MFGLYEDRHHARFASDLLVENNPRLNVFALLRSGALTDGVVTRLKWGEKTCQLTAQRTGILLDDGEQRQRVAIVWHSPLPWIGKPAFVCPLCNHDCYCLHEKAGVFACRKCHGMSYASRHLYRTVPGVHRVARLRRKIGADPRPFTPLPRRPRHHIRFHRVVARILFEERALLNHLRTVTHDLEDHGCSIAEVNRALDLFAVATINAKVRTHTLALELSRLDELQSVFYERAKAGDVASGMLLTKIMERRSCLLGLNSPVRVDAQLLIDGEQARQQPTSTERIRAAIDRIRNVPKPS